MELATELEKLELEKLSKISLAGEKHSGLRRVRKTFEGFVGSFWTSGDELETGWDDMFTKWLGVMPGWVIFYSKHAMIYLAVSGILRRAKQVDYASRSTGVHNLLVALTTFSELYKYLCEHFILFACVSYCIPWDSLFGDLMDFHTQWILLSKALAFSVGRMTDDKTWHTHSQSLSEFGLFFMFVGQVLLGVLCCNVAFVFVL